MYTLYAEFMWRRKEKTKRQIIGKISKYVEIVGKVEYWKLDSGKKAIIPPEKVGRR